LIADLHLHSKYSRATSPAMNVKGLSEAAKHKGLDIVGTGDFTHPTYLEELKSQLGEERDGMFEFNGTNFVLSSELSCIYSQDNKTRKIHHVMLAPNFDAVDQIRELLLKRGRLDYDGRPIFGITSPELVELVMGVDKDCFIFPAHIWTPWFSLFGSKSGFDSIKDCYGDTIKHIHALETGLSSDPEMNWRLSQLDDFTLVSNSDAHSIHPWRLGREANAFDIKPSFFEMIKAIKNKTMLFTIEVDPAYGKYHWDGHRKCGVHFSPQETREHNNICPVCKKSLTLGVEFRVEQLADRPVGFKPKNLIPFKTLLPVAELFSSVLGKGVATKTVQTEHDKVYEIGSELDVLLKTPEEDLKKYFSEDIVKLLLLNRDGKLKIDPGYDGVYGQLMIEQSTEQE